MLHAKTFLKATFSAAWGGTRVFQAPGTDPRSRTARTLLVEPISNVTSIAVWAVMPATRHRVPAPLRPFDAGVLLLVEGELQFNREDEREATSLRGHPLPGIDRDEGRPRLVCLRFDQHQLGAPRQKMLLRLTWQFGIPRDPGSPANDDRRRRSAIPVPGRPPQSSQVTWVRCTIEVTTCSTCAAVTFPLGAVSRASRQASRCWSGSGSRVNGRACLSLSGEWHPWVPDFFYNAYRSDHPV